MYPIKTNEFKKYKYNYRLWINKCEWCYVEFKSHMKYQRFCSASCSSKHKIKQRFPIPETKENESYCNFCKRILPIESFYPSQRGRQSRCKWCYNLQSSQRRFGISEKEYNQMIEDQNWNCGICGESFKEGYIHPEKISLKNRHINISIDHKDPSKEDNINNYHIVHHSCNTFKQNLTMGELYDWCEKVIKHITESAK